MFLSGSRAIGALTSGKIASAFFQYDSLGFMEQMKEGGGALNTPAFSQ